MRYPGLIVCALAVALATSAQGAAAELRAGVAVADITPPVPFRMAGHFRERISTGVKDPLHAKAIVLQQGDESAAIVLCDLVGISLDLSTTARRKASEATGIPFDNIAVAATHSHTGPLLFGVRHDFFHERHVEQFGEDPYESSAYRGELVEKIAAAVVEAHSAIEPVTLRSGNAHEDRLVFNRRFHMKDGTVRFNPGQLNPDIVRPAGPIDPQVGIVAIHPGDSEQPSSLLMSYALHLDTVGGTEYSADYPKFVEDHLRETLGPGFILLFGSGTSGDINHIDVTTQGRRSAAEIGRMLGETVAQALQQPHRLSAAEPALAVRSVRVETPLQTFSAEAIENARERMQAFGSRGMSFLERVETVKILDMDRWEGDSVPIEVQVVRLTRDTAIVLLPAEIFVELGLAIKAASPFETTLIIELANDSLGYIPTRRAFAEGSYETINSRVTPGSGERLVEAAIELLKELE